MCGHQSTADGVNGELDQLQQMANPSIDMLMADMNPNPDFSGAPDIHATLENNTQSNTSATNTTNTSNTTSSDTGGHDNTAL